VASYKTHTAFNVILLLPGCLAAGQLIFEPQRELLGLFTIAFLYATLFMSPDLDLAGQIKLFSLRGVLSLPFRIYAMIFRHRGLSHFPILGSFTRIGWLAGIATIIFFLIYKTLPEQQPLLNFYETYQVEIIWVLMGIILADLGHLILDAKPR